jgi:hypothetical protein
MCICSEGKSFPPPLPLLLQVSFANGSDCGHDSLTWMYPSTATSVGGEGSSFLVGLLGPISKGAAAGGGKK